RRSQRSSTPWGTIPKRSPRVSPQKIPETDAIFAKVNQINQAADAADDVLRISMDAKATASLNNLAELYRDQGRYADAEPLPQRALVILEQTLGPGHPDVAASLNGLALLYHTQGRYAQAEPLYQRALAIVEHVLGSLHPLVAKGLNNLAGLYRHQG